MKDMTEAEFQECERKRRLATGNAGGTFEGRKPKKKKLGTPRKGKTRAQLREKMNEEIHAKLCQLGLTSARPTVSIGSVKPSDPARLEEHRQQAAKLDSIITRQCGEYTREREPAQPRTLPPIIEYRGDRIPF